MKFGYLLINNEKESNYMAQATICDICKKIITFYDNSFQVKKLKDVPGYDNWPRKRW